MIYLSGFPPFDVTVLQGERAGEIMIKRIPLERFILFISVGIRERKVCWEEFKFEKPHQSGGRDGA